MTEKECNKTAIFLSCGALRSIDSIVQSIARQIQKSYLEFQVTIPKTGVYADEC
jgi:hypothetical protein